MQDAWNVIGLSVAALCAGCASTGVQSASAERSAYEYSLTPVAVQQCAIVQDRLSTAKQATDPEWARYHKAMALTWERVGKDLGNANTGSFAAAADAMPVTQLSDLARPCEVMSRIHPEYSAASFEIEDDDPALFAGNAARKFQTGGTPAELPRKTLSFANWEFESRGNSCLATHTFGDGAKLTLGFTNFFDGAIRFAWDELPLLDIESDQYEERFALHRAGAVFDDDTMAVFADGVNYSTYPGTAIFVDGQVLAIPQDGLGEPQEYVLGAYVQQPYYNRLAEGRKLTIKVLGKETHRLELGDAAFWNEFSNCVAQYPFG